MTTGSTHKKIIAGMATASVALLRMCVEANLVCPTSGATKANKTVMGFDPIRRFTEISGLALSHSQTSPTSGNPIMYVINDGNDNDSTGGGGAGRIGVYDSGSGQRLLTLLISKDTVPSSYDWEALAIGPCGSDGDDITTSGSCIYIADVGDNVARNTKGRRTGRTEQDPYRIIKIREPLIDKLPYATQDNATVPGAHISTLRFDYMHPSSPTNYADCEGVFLDSTSELYLVTKWNTANVTLSRLYKIPTMAWNVAGSSTTSLGRQAQQEPPIFSPEAVGSYSSNTELTKWTWTGADATADGSIIALSSYTGTAVFLRCPGSTIAEALTGTAQSCERFLHPSPGQVETSAWTADGKHHLQIPEGRRPTMGWTTMIYSNDDEQYRGRACPMVEWVVVSGGPTYCRSIEDQSPKPDDWCHLYPDFVPFIYVDSATIDEGLVGVSTSQSSAWQSTFLLVRTLLAACVAVNVIPLWH